MSFTDIIDIVSDCLWSYVLLVLLLSCALWFSVKTRFVQFSMLREIIRLIFESFKSAPAEESLNARLDPLKGLTPVDENGQSRKELKSRFTRKNKGGKDISSFQAFAISMSSQIGVGNLAGVSIAVVVGGPGAVFWMWALAVLSAATSFVECTISQLYKVRGKDSYLGGPSYYMTRGLNRKWMAALFAFFMILNSVVNNSVQSNTLVAALNHAFGWDALMVGVILAFVVICIILGGVRRISKISQIVVPVMAFSYIFISLFVMCMNISHLPAMLSLIVKNAFGIGPVVGGGLGAAMLTGVKRGLFSNEAGLGTSPIAAATAQVSHPVKQGLVQCLAVFTDTVIICSCTAFIVLLGIDHVSSGTDGIELTQEALSYHIGSFGTYFLAFALFFFVFSSFLSNCFYAESNLLYFTKNKALIYFLRICCCGIITVGAVIPLRTVWGMADICIALLALCNLAAIIPLSRMAFRLLDDYRDKKKRGIDSPTFHKGEMDEIRGRVECWE